MKNVGIDISPPKSTCEDPHCPFHGSLKVRGRLITGKTVSVKSQHSSVIQREYLHYVKKYSRYEKRRGRLLAHLPTCLDVREGDIVTVGECRPLTKEVSFVVLGKAE